MALSCQDVSILCREIPGLDGFKVRTHVFLPHGGFCSFSELGCGFTDAPFPHCILTGHSDAPLMLMPDH